MSRRHRPPARTWAWKSVLAAGLIVLGGNLLTGRARPARAIAEPQAERGDAAPAIVINEIFYHAPLDIDELEYIELLNAGNQTADLSGWRLGEGVRFRFPAGSELVAGGHAVLVRDAAAFRRHFGPGIPIAGVYEKALGNGGDTVTLLDPAGEEVERVRYEDRAPWPVSADGCGSSLERIAARCDPAEAGSWAPSPLPVGELKPGGTPGSTNAASATNLPPIFSEITRPGKDARPEASVVVRARVADADGVERVELHYAIYRVQGTLRAEKEESIAMALDEGDARAGFYTGVIPPQAEGRLVRFHLEAEDTLGMQRRSPHAGDLRPAYSYTVRAPSEATTVPLGIILQTGNRDARQRFSRSQTRPEHSSRGEAAFVLVDPDGATSKTYDFVRVDERSGGYKVRFHKDNPVEWPVSDGGEPLLLRTINVIFESTPRFVLAEHLAYEVYRRAGVPSPTSGHLRLLVDGQPLGYHLVVEQPNRSFLRRNGRPHDGDLFKLLWYGRDVVGQHERKTNAGDGHEELVTVVETLDRLATLEPDAQWKFIEETFEIEEFVAYYAASMCLSNWDGYHNNFFVYHDGDGSGKWEIYPWDEDKTWGYHDGTPREGLLIDMPLTFGSDLDRVPGDPRASFERSRYTGQGPIWWRAPGHLSGPLLKNPRFRARFLARLRGLLETVFTEETLLPVIEKLERRLEPEVSIRARAAGSDPAPALRRFAEDMASLRRFLRERRRFLLAQPELRAPR